MTKPLSIRIIGKLNQTETVRIIQKQLNEISSKLKVTIGVDTKQIDALNNKIKQTQEQANKKKVTIVGDKEVTKVKELYTSLDRAVEKYSKLGQVKVNKTFNPATKDLEKFTLSITKANGEVDRLKFELDKLRNIHGTNGFALVGKTTTDNSAHTRERQLQTVQKINTQINRQNQQLQHQLEMFKQQARLDASNLKNRYGNSSRFDQAGLNSWLNSVNNLNTSTPNATQQMDRLRMQFRGITSDARNAQGMVRDFGGTLENAFVRMPVYAAAATAMFLPFQALNSLIDTLYLLDERLVSINKVLEDGNLSQIFKDADDSAMNFGQTIDSVLESYGEIAKLGFNAEEAGFLNDQSMLLKTVGEFQSNADAANSLVAIYRQYKLELEGVSKVVDSLNEVSNKTGADTVGLSEALSKASSSANVAGMSFDELLGTASTVQEVLKISGSQVGTFLKTLSSRFLRDASQNALEGIGIQTKTVSGELRSLTDVMQDLGEQWDTLDSQTQNAISSQLGGGWHNSKTIALIENQDRVLRNTEVSMNSYGSATRELETFQEGLQFQTNEMIASFQNLAMAIGENGARDAIVKFLETVTFMTRGFTDLTEATDGWNIKLPLLAVGVYGLVKAFTLLSTVAKGAKLSLGWMGVGLVGLEAIGTLVAGVAKTNLDTANTLSETGQKYGDNAARLSYLSSKLSELEPQIKNNTTANEEYKSVLDEIHEIAPQVTTVTGKYGDVIDVNKDKLSGYIGVLKEMSQEQLNQADLLLSNSLLTAQNDLEKLIQKQGTISKDVQKDFDFVNEMNKKYNVTGVQSFAEKTKEALDELGLFNEDYKQMANDFGQYNNIFTVGGQDLKKYNEIMSKVQEKESQVDDIKKRQQAIKDMSSSLRDGTYAQQDYDGAINNASQKVGDTTQAVDGAIEGMDTYSESIDGASSSVNGLSQSQDELKTTTEQMMGVSTNQIDNIYEMISVYELLSKAENLNDNQKQLLADSTAYLSSVYPTLVKGSQANIGIMKKEIESTDVLKQAIDKMAQGQLSAQDQMTTSTAIGTKNRLNLLNKEITAYNEFFRQADLTGNTLEQEKLASRRYATISVDINSLMSDLDQYTGTLSNSLDIHGRYTQSAIDTAKANAKAAEEADKSAYATDKFKQATEKLNLELEKQRAIQAKFPEHSKKYQDSLKAELKLLEKKKELLQDQSKSLEKQIKSGNIKQTGVYTIPTTTTVSSSSRGGSYSGQYASIINQAANKYGVDANLVAAIIKAESGFNSNARSHASAMGLMQLMPGTARGLGVSNAYDPYQNIMGGTKYIKQMLDANNGNIQLALASYNAGLGNVRKYGGIPPFAETQKYVPKVLGYYNSYGGSGAFTASASSSSSNVSKDAANKLSQIDSAKSEVLQMQQEILNIENEMQQLYMEIVDSQIASFDRQKQSYEDDLSKIDLIQNREVETSNKWIQQQGKKEAIITKQINLDKQAIKFMSEQIKTNKKLNEAQKALLEDQLVDRYQTLYSLEQKLLDERTNMANQIIDTYKKSVEAQKNAAIDAIDKMINGINKQAEEADYTKRLEKAQKDRQEIMDKIVELSLDDSFAAQKQVAELNKQLQEQDQSIMEMQDEKTRNDRIENLNKQKEKIESDYDNLINDERKFNKMRSDIINANSKQIQKDLDKYYKNIKDNANVLGKSLSNNLIDLINQANKYLNGKDYKPIKVASAAKGGILPSWGSEGKAMVVHEEEMISNKHDTKNLLKAMDVADGLSSKLKGVDLNSLISNKFNSILAKRPKLTNFETKSANGASNVLHNSITLQIDGNIYGDREFKKKVVDTVNKEVMGGIVTGVKLLGGTI
ncbi:phage tail tape measure protein [Cytobacillus kochii]|uniref:phage tail tape measure protein n=1 Tax=Cytobacillus kochii TaxID=859143 RepID=UPI00296F86DD|nr:phage tail tape measure protein [Cytobacillus kochii]